jgi:hypothetical protein
LTSAGERDALLLTAGELAGLALAEVAELHQLERLAGSRADLVPADLAPLEPERHVLLDAEMREERVRLEDGVDVPLVGRALRDVVAAEEDAPVGGLLEAADHAQRGGLSTARGPEQGVERAARHLEIERVDRRHVAEALRDPLEADVGLSRVH